MRYALVIGGKVDNVVIWDGVAAFDLPDGMIRVSIGDTEWCEIGASYDEQSVPRFYAVPQGD